MLHKIELPFSPEELGSIFALQIQLLELTCQVNHALNRSAIEAHLQDTVVTDWVMNSYSRTIGSLNSFASNCDITVKRKILEELKADYAFWEHRNDNRAFIFRFQATDPCRELIAGWLKGYFKQFGSGIDAVITKTQFINKGVWVEAFRKANPNIHTCPVCDGSMKSGVTIEHFFPREKYPVLSVHVANLIPVCNDCNSLKENKDPLENASLTRLFLPYHRHALEVCDIEVATNTNGNYEFILISKNQNSDLTIELREMARLFKVPEQWNRNIQHIVDVAIAKVQEQLDADQEEGINIKTEAEFKAMLDKLHRRMVRQCGRQHYFVPAVSWLKWAKENEVNQLWHMFKPKKISPLYI